MKISIIKSLYQQKKKLVFDVRRVVTIQIMQIDAEKINLKIKKLSDVKIKVIYIICSIYLFT